MSDLTKEVFVMKKAKLSTFLITLLSLTSLMACDPNNIPSSNSKSNSGSISSSDSGSSESTSNPSSSGSVIDLTSIKLNKTETSILLNSKETLTVSFTPTNATDKEVEWSSDDATIASVDNGVVTAKKIGVANITVKSKKNASISATCKVTVKDNVILSNVSAKHEFVLFEQNRAKDEKNDDGFYDHTQSYKVGDDNPFNVKPALTVLDAKTYQPVSASQWLHDFTISAKLGDTTVDEEYFKVLDARECNVDFTEEAVGKTFTITIAPGGVDDSRVASLTKSITVDVMDGYNVYNAKELGYFDTRPVDFTRDSPVMEDGNDWRVQWREFKAANNMDVDYVPAALIFQTDIAVTASDLPANFFYTAEQAAALNDRKAAGSLVDFTYFYERTIPGDMTVEGNYFDLDFSAIPLIKRDRQKTTAEGEVIGHASAFKTLAGDDVIFRNINMTGNGKKATGDEDKIYSGGIIFIKGAGSKTLKAYNMIATKFYITFFGEEGDEGESFTQFELDKVKCFDNYNSFLYNWGSTITAKNTLFRSCGGPVLIQDHTDTDTYEENNGMTVLGHAPTANFIDCTIKNYVTGSEAWFQQFGATAKAGEIKMLSDLFYATGLTKSYVTNDKGEGKLYAALSAADENAFFNFIVLNKSGNAEGITTTPSCGTVNMINTGVTNTFDYRQPAYDSVYQAYVAYNVASDEDKPAAQQALIAAAMAKGVEFAPDYSDANDKITAYITGICTQHMTLRGLNNAGAPVMDLGEKFGLLAYDGANNFLQPMESIAAGTVNKFTPTSDQLANIPSYGAVYFGGMALVVELTPYVA